MKATPLLVQWHEENAAIYSAHFAPHGTGRLATAGSDNTVRVGNPSPCYEPADRPDMEGGAAQRREEGHIPVHPLQAPTDGQRRPLVAPRCVKLHVALHILIP